MDDKKSSEAFPVVVMAKLTDTPSADFPVIGPTELIDPASDLFAAVK